jgi:hypothetical protein
MARARNTIGAHTAEIVRSVTQMNPKVDGYAVFTEDDKFIGYCPLGQELPEGKYKEAMKTLHGWVIVSKEYIRIS